MGFLCPQASLLRMAWELGKGGVPADCNFILSYLWRVSSKIAPNHFHSGPALDPRSKIQDCPEVLRGRSWIQCSAESFPNHFDSGTALGPRSKIAQGSCQGILDPTLTRWIQDSLAKPLGNLGSWIQGRARIKMIRK